MKKVGKRFKRNAAYLKALKSARSAKKRMSLVNRANPNQIFAIMDAANNILNGNFPITSRQKSRMLPYRDTIRQLGRARTLDSARAVLQNGNGCFLPCLLAPIIQQVARKTIKII